MMDRIVTQSLSSYSSIIIIMKVVLFYFLILYVDAQPQSESDTSDSDKEPKPKRPRLSLDVQGEDHTYLLQIVYLNTTYTPAFTQDTGYYNYKDLYCQHYSNELCSQSKA